MHVTSGSNIREQIALYNRSVVSLILTTREKNLRVKLSFACWRVKQETIKILQVDNEFSQIVQPLVL